MEPTRRKEPLAQHLKKRGPTQERRRSNVPSRNATSFRGRCGIPSSITQLQHIKPGWMRKMANQINEFSHPQTKKDLPLTCFEPLCFVYGSTCRGNVLKKASSLWNPKIHKFGVALSCAHSNEIRYAQLCKSHRKTAKDRTRSLLFQEEGADDCSALGLIPQVSPQFENHFCWRKRMVGGSWKRDWFPKKKIP